jgi:hypothetical protein
MHPQIAAALFLICILAQDLHYSFSVYVVLVSAIAKSCVHRLRNLILTNRIRRQARENMYA